MSRSGPQDSTSTPWLHTGGAGSPGEFGCPGSNSPAGHGSAVLDPSAPAVAAAVAAAAAGRSCSPRRRSPFSRALGVVHPCSAVPRPPTTAIDARGRPRSGRRRAHGSHRSAPRGPAACVAVGFRSPSPAAASPGAAAPVRSARRWSGHRQHRRRCRPDALSGAPTPPRCRSRQRPRPDSGHPGGRPGRRHARRDQNKSEQRQPCDEAQPPPR